MFTGIIQALGKIHSLESDRGGLRYTINLNTLECPNLEIGESIAINGACHTIEKIENGIAAFYSSPETLKLTTLNQLSIGNIVNLELSLTPNTRMGGHFVSGHIDCISELVNIQNDGESYLITCQIPAKYHRYIIHKGSIALNGISLTIAKVIDHEKAFQIAVIPHTWQATNLQHLQAGSQLNCEIDQIAKYTERLISL